MIQNINNQPAFKGRIDGFMPIRVLRDGETVMESLKLDNLISTPEQDKLIRSILSTMEISKSKAKLTDELKSKVQELFEVMEKIIGKPVPFDKEASAILLKAIKRNNGVLKGVSYSKYFPPQEGGSVNLNFSFKDTHLFEKWK